MKIEKTTTQEYDERMNTFIIFLVENNITTNFYINCNKNNIPNKGRNKK